MATYKIPFNNVGQTARIYKQQIFKRIASIIDSNIFLNGQENKLLIVKLQNYLGSKYITLTASGHDAILTSLSSLNLNERDEVIFPVNSYPTAFPVCLSNGKPVPVDVDLNGQIDPDDIQQKITARTKAIIIVHLYGLVGNIDKIIKTIKGRDVILIEDCAQAVGSLYKNRKVGTIGDIGCFSFYPTKTISTLGDGGFITTTNKTFFEYFNKAVQYGEKKRYHSEFVSGHSRIAEIQAGIINVLFSSINKTFLKRKKVADYYRKLIVKKGLSQYVNLCISSRNSDPVEHLFVIKAYKRNELQRFLYRKGIETLVHYPTPIHLLPAFSYLNYKKGDFKMAEELSNQILSLPFHPYLTKANVDYVVDSIKSFYG